jgi:hypothetical protein
VLIVVALSHPVFPQITDVPSRYSPGRSFTDRTVLAHRAALTVLVRLFSNIHARVSGLGSDRRGGNFLRSKIRPMVIMGTPTFEALVVYQPQGMALDDYN